MCYASVIAHHRVNVGKVAVLKVVNVIKGKLVIINR